MNRRKLIKYILLLGLAIILFELGLYLHGMLSVGAAYNAKVMCSAKYVADRDESDILQQDIAMSVSDLLGARVDTVLQQAVSSFLWVERKAQYRKGAGCTLIPANPNIPKLIPLEPNIKSDIAYRQDSLLWPMDSVQLERYNQVVYDSTKLKKAVEYAFDPNQKDRQTRALLIIKNGRVVVEKYGEGFDKNTPLLGWSMTKSVVNSLLGILIADSILTLQDPAPVPEWQSSPADPRRNITIEDLLQMSSGLDWDENYATVSDVNKMLWQSHNAAAFAARAPLTHPPGTHWQYSSGTTNILCGIMRAVLNDDKQYHQLPYKRIFAPLGMKSATMEVDASGNFIGSSFMYATARDWAKWGMLYLRNGRWGTTQIIPSDWISYSQKPSPALPEEYYGAHFWHNTHDPNGNSYYWPKVPADAYYATGYEGQNIVIVPSLDLLVVRLGCTPDRKLWDLGHMMTLTTSAFML